MLPNIDNVTPRWHKLRLKVKQIKRGDRLVAANLNVLSVRRTPTGRYEVVWTNRAAGTYECRVWPGDKEVLVEFPA